VRCRDCPLPKVGKFSDVPTPVAGDDDAANSGYRKTPGEWHQGGHRRQAMARAQHHVMLGLGQDEVDFPAFDGVVQVVQVQWNQFEAAAGNLLVQVLGKGRPLLPGRFDIAKGKNANARRVITAHAGRCGQPKCCDETKAQKRKQSAVCLG